jgi:hypothetical protein
MDDDNAKRIAALNDEFRRDFYFPSFGPRRVPGYFVCTRGISALPPKIQIEIWAAVSQFDDFGDNNGDDVVDDDNNNDNDPYGERDFGAVMIDGVAEKIFWKIDYYADKSCALGASDPADPAQSFRVLTIMLASDY